MADVGTGVTIEFAASSFSADVLDVSHGDQTREVVDTTHMGTTGARTKMPGDLYDAGEFTMEWLLDPDTQPPITQAAETITITFPVPSGLTNGATLAGTGFVSAWSWGAPLEDRMTGTATITWDGGTDPAWVDAS